MKDINNNPFFAVMENSVRCVIINKKLEQSMLHIDHYPILRFKDKDFNWVIYKLNIVISLPSIWHRLITKEQSLVIENALLDYITKTFNINNACSIVGLYEYIKS